MLRLTVAPLTQESVALCKSGLYVITGATIGAPQYPSRRWPLLRALEWVIESFRQSPGGRSARPPASSRATAFAALIDDPGPDPPEERAELLELIERITRAASTRR